MINISHTRIKSFFEEKLCQISLPREVIDTTIESLVEASLFGIDSHGVNLFSHYFECLRNGRVKKGENIDLEVNNHNNIENFLALKTQLKPLCKNFVDFGNYFSENVELD